MSLNPQRVAALSLLMLLSAPAASASNPSEVSLRQRLVAAAGAKGPVVVFANASGLLAASPDGSWRQFIHDKPVSWALMDPHADVIWFGSDARKRHDVGFIDLRATGASVTPVPVLSVPTGPRTDGRQSSVPTVRVMKRSITPAPGGKASK